MNIGNMRKILIMVFGIVPLALIVTFSTFLFLYYSGDIFVLGSKYRAYFKFTFPTYLICVIGLFGLFLSILTDERVISVGRFKKCLILTGYFVLVVLYYIVIVSLARDIASGIVKEIGLNITKSCANGAPYCYQYEWDTKLKLVVYILYSTIFIIFTIFVLLAIKYSASANLTKFLVVLFVLNFPTYTKWRVNCDYESGCYDGGLGKYDHELVVPVILSISPEYILTSVCVAYALLWLYSRILGVPIWSRCITKP